MLYLDSNDINAYDSFLDCVQNSKPCIVKNIFSTENGKLNRMQGSENTPTIKIVSNESKCTLEGILEYFNNNKKCEVYGCYVKKGKDIICSNSFLEKIQNEPSFSSFSTRIWEDYKDKFTRDHYDGNGIEVLNISLTGKKRFMLAKPNSFSYIPFTNISYIPQNDAHYDYEVILENNEMLYIPAFWHHQVYTLENNTRNLNFNFSNSNVYISPRNKAMFVIHKTFNSDFWNNYVNEKIQQKINYTIVNPIVLYYIVTEMGIYIAIALFLMFSFLHNKMLILFGILVFSFLSIWQFLNDKSGGMSSLYFKIIVVLLIIRGSFLINLKSLKKAFKS